VSRVSAFIADDEPLARAGLRHALAREGWLQVVGEAGDGEAALAAVQGLRPELLFLDVQMPGLSGTAVLQRLLQGGEPLPLVVFTTAYAEHAVTAFELGAIDYLLKPFGPERLGASLASVRASLGEPCPPLLERWALAHSSGPLTRLFVRRGALVVALRVAELTHIEAEDDYLRLHRAAGADGGSDLLRLPLSRLEERLDPTRFVRIHRGCIVNLDHLARFRRLPTGALQAELKDATTLPVSRARAKEIRRLIE